MQRRKSEGILKNGSGAQNGTDSSSDEEKEAAECEDDDETVEVGVVPNSSNSNHDSILGQNRLCANS